MPTLLSSTSMRPNVETQASTIAATSAALLTSARCAAAWPPSSLMIPTVSSAAARLMSAQNTRAPSRANATAVALPLPQPGPIDPAPTTSATLLLSRSAMSVLLLGRVKSKEQHHTTSMGMGFLCTITAQLADFESGPTTPVQGHPGSTRDDGLDCRQT